MRFNFSNHKHADFLIKRAWSLEEMQRAVKSPTALTLTSGMSFDEILSKIKQCQTELKDKQK